MSQGEIADRVVFFSIMCSRLKPHICILEASFVEDSLTHTAFDTRLIASIFRESHRSL